MEEKTGMRPHKLLFQNRQGGSLTGIRDVVAFDENQVVLDTDMGLFDYKGKRITYQPAYPGKRGGGYGWNGGQPDLFLQ